MKYEATIVALAGMATAREVSFHSKMAKREVPQEHSHESILTTTNEFLQLDNPLEIQDTVFALLGNAAAADGAPNVEDLDCLQQIIADQAFTNAKAIGDINGMANAVMFRALERNTVSVGLASVLCTQTAVNPEIAAITQHQDPASEEAAGNADIALEVARQLASFGADPLLAIQTGTFAPGEIGDPTAAGNTCDDIDDPVGCIFTQNLLVPDVTEEEIQAAVADIQVGAVAGAGAGAANGCNLAAGAAAAAGNAAVGNAAAGNAAAGNDAGNAAAGNDAGNAAAGNDAANDAAGDAAAGAATDGAATAAAGNNLQTFSGTLGGAAPEVIQSDNGDKPFAVNGATFGNLGAALERSCSVQHNACANAANAGQIDGGTGQCEDQQDECDAAAAAQKVRRASVRSRKHRVSRAVNTGNCGSPKIQFGVGLDGRKEESFQAVNQDDFNHGSAQGVQIITDFICSQLASSCQADAATVQTCNDASAAAQQATGQAAADAFNNALGV